MGNTTKKKKAGEGIGTRQIYSTFSPENITVDSVYGKGTRWEILFDKSLSGSDKQFLKLERQFNEFKTLWEEYSLSGNKTRNDIIAYIWQIRKMEIFSV